MTTPSLTTSTRFLRFLSNLALTEAQQADGTTKHGGVRRALNAHYYNLSSTGAHSMLVGSWGKSTEVRPPRDIDVLFELPADVHARYEQVFWPRNKQSELLQEVKRILGYTYPHTTMRGDGQVVTVQFDSYAVEVLPAFRLRDSRFLICDTNDGGRYKTIHPVAEQEAVRISNSSTNGNTRCLIRMMKSWQSICSVPMKSFWIELLAVEFLHSWQYRHNSATYHDWMVRDFLAYIIRRASGILSVPGTGEIISLGDAWKSRAESAHARAIKACSATSEYEAGTEWQKIFGDQMPLLP